MGINGKRKLKIALNYGICRHSQDILNQPSGFVRCADTADITNALTTCVSLCHLPPEECMLLVLHSRLDNVTF